MKKVLLLIKMERAPIEMAERAIAGPPQIPDDDVHFQRFRYPTK
jgi:hypothetical protein